MMENMSLSCRHKMEGSICILTTETGGALNCMI